MTKARSNCCKITLKVSVENEEKMQQVTVSLAAAKESSTDAAVGAVSSEADGILMYRRLVSGGKDFSLYSQEALARV